MDKQTIKNTLFAVLFAGGEPLELARIADAAMIVRPLCELLLQELQDELDERNAGVCLLRYENRWQLATRQAYAEAVSRMIETRRNTPLSQAALEVLALIAYNQPVSRAFIDQVRGVDSASPVATLLARGLIAEGDRLDLPGRPISFVTTDTFLRCFGLSSLSELPSVHGFLDPEEDEPAAQEEE